MNTMARRVALCGLVFSSAMLSGCLSLFDRDSAPINYYVLSAAPSSPATALAATGGPVFAVAPVRVPQYLSQRPIVTRTSDNEVSLAANDQWAGPLSEDIRSTLSENLSLLIPSDRVVELPVSAAVPVDYEIRVEIVSFERQPDGSVDLVARWTVFGEGGRSMIAMERSSLRTPVVANDYPSIVAAMSGLLLKLSREIAGQLRTTAVPLS